MSLLPRFLRFALVGTCGTGVAAYLFIPDKSRAAPTVNDASLAPSHFTKATLTSTVTTSAKSKILELKVPEFRKHNPDFENKPIWSVYIKDDDIQVERPYTPLEGIDEEGRMRFWIKKYPKGEVGRWLHSKQLGDKIEFRGPLSTWAWNGGQEWDEIVMISGGTGIAPFYQLIHSVFSKPGSVSENARFTLLHSSLSPADLPPPEIMDPLCAYANAYPDRFTLRLFVDRTDGQNKDPSLWVSRINKPVIEHCLGLASSWWQAIFASKNPAQRDKKLFLVCGPEGMVAAIAGPYGRNFSQGSVGGVLGELGFSSKEVVKL